MAHVLLHRVQGNDTLPTISKAYYGTDRFAEALYEHNRELLGANPNHLTPGTELVIPRIGAMGG